MTSMSHPGMGLHLDPTPRRNSRVFPPHPTMPVAPSFSGASLYSLLEVPPVIGLSSARQLNNATDLSSSAAPSLTHHTTMTEHDERRLAGHSGVARQPSSPPRKYRTILPSSVPALPPAHPLEELVHDPPEFPTRNTSEARSHSPDPTTHELRPRKKRNMYTPQQRDVLVHYFETVTDHPTKDQRMHLIKLVGTDDQTVRVWFQNYRAKVQRDVKQVGAPGAEVGGGAYWSAPVVAGYTPVLIPTGSAATVGPNVVGFVVPQGYAGPGPAPVPGYAWVEAPLAPEYPVVQTMGPPSPVHQAALRAGIPSPPPFGTIPEPTDSPQCIMQFVDRSQSPVDRALPVSPVSRQTRDKAKHVPHLSQSSYTSAHATLAAAIPTLPLPVPLDADVIHGGGAAAVSLGRSRGSPSKRRGGGDAPSSPTKRAKRKEVGSPAHALAAQMSSLWLVASRTDSVPAVAHPPAFLLPDGLVSTASFDDRQNAVVLPDALPATGAFGGARVFSDLVDPTLAMDLDLVPNDIVPLQFPTDAEPLPFPTDAVPLPFHADTAPQVPSPQFQHPANRTRWIKADADSMLDVTAETPFRDAAASPSVLFGLAGTVGDDSPDALLGARLGAVPTDTGRDTWVDASLPEPLDVDVALQQWAEVEPDPVVASKSEDVGPLGPASIAGGTLGYALGTASGANDRVDSGPRLAL